MSSVWEIRYQRLRIMAWLVVAASVCAVAAILTADFMRVFMSISAGLFFAPAFIYTYVIVIWHWKDRYRGKHSDLWGALILIETSGWMKIVYLFRHLIPDIRHTGRYRSDA